MIDDYAMEDKIILIRAEINQVKEELKGVDPKHFRPPSSEQVKERQDLHKDLLEKERDKRLEQALKAFTKTITDNESVSSPEIIAVPRGIMIQITDGSTDVAAYSPRSEVIYVNSENPHPLMFSMLHEAKHHIDYKKRGMAYLTEVLKCRDEGIPHDGCPPEKRANQFAIENVVKYIDDWKEKVEPVVGKVKILPPLEKL